MELNIEKTIKESFAWFSKDSLVYIIVMIAIGLVGSILSILMISGFIDSMLAMLQNPMLLIDPSILMAEIIGFMMQFAAFMVVLAIISFFVSVWAMAYALKKLGSKTASFSIMKGLKIIAALILIGIGIAISAIVMVVFFAISPIIGLILMIPYIIALVYFLIRFCLYTAFIVDKDVGVIDSLKASFAATKSNVLRIFAAEIVVGILVFIVFAIVAAILGLALSPVVDSALGNDIGSKLTQITPIIDALSQSSTELSTFTPEVLKPIIVKFCSDMLANSLMEFIMVLTMMFLSASIFMQLSQRQKTEQRLVDAIEKPAAPATAARRPFASRKPAAKAARPKRK